MEVGRALVHSASAVTGASMTMRSQANGRARVTRSPNTRARRMRVVGALALGIAATAGTAAVVQGQGVSHIVVEVRR